MTRMVPPTIHSSVRSGAERRLFTVIQRAEGTEGWYCLHSLALARHATKRRGEIDFLLLHPEGIFVLEVKGGRIRREDGRWIMTDRWGREHVKHEGPFEQAAGCMFALDRHLGEAFADRSRLAHVMLGYGVMVPDIEFDAVGVDADPRQVFDRRTKSFGTYVRGLVEYTRSTQHGRRNGLRKNEIEMLVEHLRGDFDLVPAFEVRAADINAGLLTLTRAQAECLACAHDEERLIVEGPAGTGKTIIALEVARREARAGRRVLLLCYNVMLAHRLRAAVREPALNDLLTVDHFHGYARRLIEAAGLTSEFDDACRQASTQDEIYQTLYPYYAELARSEDAGSSFDVLVVDEAQDILTPDVVAVLDASVKGGMAGGRWRIFQDANEQAALYGKLDSATHARLRRMATTRALSLNCRNTTEIELATRTVAQPQANAVATQSGDPVERRWYSDEATLIRELRAVLGELQRERVPPGTVSLLVPTRPSRELENELRSMGFAGLRKAEADALGTGTLQVATWSTVPSFKGLENDIVILAGVARINNDWWRAAAYVGMSRARVRLYVLLHESLREVVEMRFEEILRAKLKGEFEQ